jgi:translation initiation factor IF-1
MQNRPPNRGNSNQNSRSGDPGRSSGPPRGIVGGNGPARSSSGPPRGIVGGGSSGPPRGIVGGNQQQRPTSLPPRNAPPPRRPEPEPEVKQKEEAIELEGVISSVLAGTMFKVKLRNGHEVLAHISGKMRKKFIRLVIGDAVKLEMSPYDMDKARIVYRIG